jgi:hypothetical protein
MDCTNDDKKTCGYVYQKGPKKGTKCPTPLKKYLEEGFCYYHLDSTKQKAAMRSSSYQKEHKDDVYKVTIDNKSKVLKRIPPEETVTRVVKDQRAGQLKRKGAKIEKISSSSSASSSSGSTSSSSSSDQLTTSEILEKTLSDLKAAMEAHDKATKQFYQGKHNAPNKRSDTK